MRLEAIAAGDAREQEASPLGLRTRPRARRTAPRPRRRHLDQLRQHRRRDRLRRGEHHRLDRRPELPHRPPLCCVLTRCSSAPASSTVVVRSIGSPSRSAIDPEVELDALARRERQHDELGETLRLLEIGEFS